MIIFFGIIKTGITYILLLINFYADMINKTYFIDFYNFINNIFMV